MGLTSNSQAALGRPMQPAGGCADRPPGGSGQRPVSIERFALSRSTNYEILVAWLVLALRSGHFDVLPRVEDVLGAVGRMKYLRPLYSAMAVDERSRPAARRIFDRLRDSYHPIARQVVEGVLRNAP